MNIEYKTKKLGKICTDINLATKEFGPNNAKKLITRLYDIQAAETLSDLSPLPPTRCHRLKGSLKKFLAIDLEQPCRLIMLPIDEKSFGLDLDKVKFAQIKSVKITEVSKHYD